jgi:two-component system KDP operon response regulator KdpE
MIGLSAVHILVVTNSAIPLLELPVSSLGEVRTQTENEVAAIGARQIDEDLVVLVRSVWDDGASPLVRLLRRPGATLLLLLGRSDAATRAEALETGADLVLDVAVAPAELIAHARALVRRSNRVRHGPLDMDITGRKARLDGKPFALSDREFDIMLVLVRRAGEVVPGADLMPRERVGRRERSRARSGRSRARPPHWLPNWLQVYVHGIRRKMGAHAPLLRTEPGVGYSFC